MPDVPASVTEPNRIIGPGAVTEPDTGGTGGGAPVEAEYVVKTANATLTAERVVTDVVRGGVRNDWSIGGQLKQNVTTAVFVVNATGAGTISNKVYASGTNPSNKVLTSFESDNDSVTIYVEVDAGPLGGVGLGWQPVVTIQGGVAPVNVTNLVAVTNTRRFTGSATISATISGTIYATVDDGGQSQNVTYTRALNPPLVLTAIFAAQGSGIYPGPSQTQFKSTDVMRLTGTTQSHATVIYVRDFEVSSSLQGPFTVTAGAFDFTATVGSRSGAAQRAQLFARVTAGAADGPNFLTTNTAVQDQTVPSFTFFAIIYPAGPPVQEALKDVETASVPISHTNAAGGDTYLYDTNGTGELTIPATTTYAATKVVTRLAGSYRESGANYRLTATRTTLNGASAIAQTTVKIAHVLPVITITDGSNAVLGRLGTDSGALGYRDWTAKIRSDQANLSTHTPSLTAPKGTWQGSWSASGTQDYTRSLRVANADILTGGQTPNNYTWGVCSVKNRANKEAIVVTTNTTYQLGGFQQRTMTIAAWPNRVGAIGVFVVQTGKLVCENLSKGGAGPNGGTIFAFDSSPGQGLTPANQVDKFCIVDGSNLVDDDNNSWYNKDEANAISNTSGTAQVLLREDA